MHRLSWRRSCKGIAANFLGCGNVADGNKTLITYDQGKRCWINKVIFKEPAATR